MRSSLFAKFERLLCSISLRLTTHEFLSAWCSNISQRFVALIFTLLLVLLESKLVNFLTHLESLKTSRKSQCKKNTTLRSCPGIYRCIHVFVHSSKFEHCSCSADNWSELTKALVSDISESVICINHVSFLWQSVSLLDIFIFWWWITHIVDQLIYKPDNDIQSADIQLTINRSLMLLHAYFVRIVWKWDSGCN